MKARGIVVAIALALPVGAPASAGAPLRGLSVWPARVHVAAGATTNVHVTNRSRRAAAFSVGVAGLGLDLHGRPHVLPAAAARALLAVRPPRLVVPPGGTATLAVRARHGIAGPGDHPALVLLTASSAGGVGVGVRVRIGVSVEVRVAGAVHRGLVLGRSTVRRHLLELSVRNRGNIEERIGRNDLVAQVWQRGRVLAVAAPWPQTLLPRGRGLLLFPLPPKVHGRVRIAVLAPRLPARARSYVVAI